MAELFKGLITDEGIEQARFVLSSQSEPDEAGWHITPYKFKISETRGEFDKSRNLESCNPTWIDGYFTKIEKYLDDKLMLTVILNGDASDVQRRIGEVYIIARTEQSGDDTSGEDYLFCLAQTINDNLVFKPGVSIEFSLYITLSNQSVGDIYEIKYYSDQDLTAYQLRDEKGQGNGYCPLNEDAVVPTQYLPNLDFANPDLSNLSSIGNAKFANPDLSNLSTTGESHFVKPSIAVTHTANSSVGSSTNPVYVNSSGVATACGFTWSTIHAVITKYNSGTSWYRVWSDGWIEQGGLTAESTDKIHTVSFLKPFSNTYYTAMCCVCDTTAAAVKNWYDTQIVTKTKASMTLGNNNATSRQISWYACGY